LNTKPNLLILTSSFPPDQQDETCGYVRDFACNLTGEFNVQVVTLADDRAAEWPEAPFALHRSKSLLPARLNRARASEDLNSLISASWAAKLTALPSLLSFFYLVFRLARRADVICSHWMVPCGLAGALVSKLTGKPHIAVEHSGAIHLLSRIRGGAALARFITGHSNRVVTVSYDLKSRLVALCPDAADRVDVISMGINLSRESSTFYKLPGEKVILFVGRLTAIKGVDILIRAMRVLDGCRLIVAGDGEERNRLEALAEELAIDAQFVGRVTASQRDRLLAIADAVVIPSLLLADGRTEGMPVICLEAMAAGRPVIASKVGGLSEVIIDGANGLLFEPGDYRMLSEKLRLLDCDDLRERICSRARETATGFGWEIVGPRFARAIKAAMRSDEPAIHNQRYKTGNANS
jgi:glycosyltransferase involved in cell wall biosynthesis